MDPPRDHGRSGDPIRGARGRRSSAPRARQCQACTRSRGFGVSDVSGPRLSRASASETALFLCVSVWRARLDPVCARVEFDEGFVLHSRSAYELTHIGAGERSAEARYARIDCIRSQLNFRRWPANIVLTERDIINRLYLTNAFRHGNRTIRRRLSAHVRGAAPPTCLVWVRLRSRGDAWAAGGAEYCYHLFPRRSGHRFIPTSSRR